MTSQGSGHQPCPLLPGVTQPGLRGRGALWWPCCSTLLSGSQACHRSPLLQAQQPDVSMGTPAQLAQARQLATQCFLVVDGEEGQPCVRGGLPSLCLEGAAMVVGSKGTTGPGGGDDVCCPVR